MAKGKKLSNDDIKKIVEAERSDAKQFGGEISDRRTEAMKYYNQEALGTEEDGKSQVVTADTLDTIEWILPQLMDIFMSEDEIVAFPPRGDDDVKQAQQETEYTNFVFMEENAGFLILYSFFKDALITINGITKTFWDEWVDEEREEYEGIGEQEFLTILDDDDVEIDEHTVYIDGEEVENYEVAQALMADYEGQLAIAMSTGAEMMAPPPQVTHDVVATRKSDNSQCRVINVAPENFGVKRDHNSVDLDDCGYCYNDEVVTESDLIVDGYDEEIIKKIPSHTSKIGEQEKEERFDDDGGVRDGNADETDSSRREILVTDHYIRLDKNGDGKAEMLMVKTAGDDCSVLLECEEVGTNPFSALTPIINTHKFYGKSIAELVMDIQKIRSTLLRQGLDNLYLSNMPVTFINKKSGVNLDDLLTRRAGGVVRADDIDGIRESATPFVAGAAFETMNMLDNMREQRTGVSKMTQGLDPNAISNSTNMVGLTLLSTAQLKIKMIARIFAETGVKSMFRKIHENLMKYEKNEKVAEITGEWVTVAPRTWRKRDKMKVKVGLGHAGKMEKIAAAESVLETQEKIIGMQGGKMGAFVTPENVYNALMDRNRLVGIHAPKRYFSDPAQNPIPPEESVISEALQIEEAKLTAKANKDVADIQVEMAKHNDEMMLKKYEIDENNKIKREQMGLDAAKTTEDLRFKYGEAADRAAAQIRKPSINQPQPKEQPTNENVEKSS